MHHCNTLKKYFYIVIQYNFTYLYTTQWKQWERTLKLCRVQFVNNGYSGVTIF